MEKLNTKPGKRRIPVYIDMTPMVDITILLLIFYMSVTVFKPPEAQAVDLPDSHSQIELPDKNAICVTITRDNAISVDFLQKVTVIAGGTAATRLKRTVWPATVERLALLINAARDTTDNKVFVVIKADAGCRYKIIDSVMKNMQANNINRFLLITNNEAERGSGDYRGEGR